MSIICKKCESSKSVKNVLANDEQRYKCKECLFNFIEGDKPIKYSSKDHLRVIKLYLENCAATLKGCSI